MQRKHIGLAILVCAVAITLSVAAVQATDWDHSAWIRDVLRPKIWKILSVVKATNLEVGAIEAKLDDSTFGLAALNIDLDAIKDALGVWPTSRQGYTDVADGLDKVGDVLDDVEDMVGRLQSRIGLWDDDYDTMTVPTVFAYLGEVLEELNDPNHGLPEIKREVANIEWKLDPGGSFYTFVDNWFTRLEGKLDNIWFLTGNAHGWPNLPGALDDIKNEVKDIRDVLGNPWDTVYHWGTFAEALEDIKLEVEWTKITVGLIKTEVESIEAKLDYWLPEIKNEIVMIEDKLDVWLPDIKNEIVRIEEKLDNIVIPEIQRIEAKLDNDVIPLLGQGLVGERANDRTEIGPLVGDTAVVGEWTHDGAIGHPKKYSVQLQIEGMEAGDQFEVKLQMWFGYGDVYRNDGTLWQMRVDSSMDGGREIVFVNQLAVDTPVRVVVTRLGTSAVPDSEFIEWLMIIEEV